MCRHKLFDGFEGKYDLLLGIGLVGARQERRIWTVLTVIRKIVSVERFYYYYYYFEHNDLQASTICSSSKYVSAKLEVNRQRKYRISGTYVELMYFFVRVYGANGGIRRRYHTRGWHNNIIHPRSSTKTVLLTAMDQESSSVTCDISILYFRNLSGQT